MRLSLLAGLAALVSSTLALDWNAIPYNPTAYPLAVRSPYLSTWLPAGKNGGKLNTAWPTFWTGSNMGWVGMVRVDGQTYTWMGNAVPAGAKLATQITSQFTSTQTIFTFTAGPVTLKATFLSPVEPNDLVRQSLPFSYLGIDITSNDGNNHNIQVYSDISAEWVSGDTGKVATWSVDPDGARVIHRIQLQSPTRFAEIGDHAEYGTAFYATPQGTGTYWQSGADSDIRNQFVSTGRLNRTSDNTFRAIRDRWPVFGLVHDVGTVKNTPDTVLFIIGYTRDVNVQLNTKNGMQMRYAYWMSAYGSAKDAIIAFIADWGRALSAANALDARVHKDAGAISAEYESLVALSMRQAFAAIELTVSKDASGAYNTNDVLMFMKEISSNGNMNTVDVIFPAFPIYLYMNPEIGRYLLEPLFQYQQSGLYPNKWSIHDMGAHYPNATAHNDGKDESMPVEESGNMLIMTLAYMQRTGKTDLASKYYNLLTQWTGFLVTDSLIPANQISTDDFAGPLANQTNLAIKGIIGIKAMSEIARILGNTADQQKFNNIANDYVPKWQSYAMARDQSHLTLAYGQDNTHGLAYNLYADKLLKLNLFPQNVYQIQTNFYRGLFNQYGIPLDTRHTWTKSDWLVYTAGTVTDTGLRNQIIQHLKEFIANGNSNAPFPDLYETISGESVWFRARPVAGGHFALLVL